MGTLVAYWGKICVLPGWLYGGYIRPKVGLYKAMGLGVPSRGPS